MRKGGKLGTINILSIVTKRRLLDGRWAIGCRQVQSIVGIAIGRNVDQNSILNTSKFKSIVLIFTGLDSRH